MDINANQAIASTDAAPGRWSTVSKPSLKLALKGGEIPTTNAGPLCRLTDRRTILGSSRRDEISAKTAVSAS